MFPRAKLNFIKLKHAVEGKTIVITGASSGIGKEVATLLANIPCHLILVARREELLVELKEHIEKNQAKVTIHSADLRKDEEIEGFINLLQQQPKGIDIVVSNAGLSIRRSIYDSLNRFHDFQRTMAINYFAPVKLLLFLIPILQKNKGQIINVSTVNALLAPVPFFTAYQASKSAFDVWLRSISQELQSKGIVVTSIYLPLVKTAMIEPTVAYKKVPAMSSFHAAKIIGKTMYTKKSKFQPWWLIFVQFISIFLRNFWDMSNSKKEE